MKQVGTVIERLANFLGYFSGGLILLMTALVLVEVIFRYIGKRPLMVADEFGAYLLVALVYLGGAYTWRRNGHIRVTFIVEKLPLKLASWLRLGTLALAMVAAIVLSVASLQMLAFSFRIGMKSGTWIHTPLQGPQMMLLIGFVMLALLNISDVTRTVVKLKSGKAAAEGIR